MAPPSLMQLISGVKQQCQALEGQICERAQLSRAEYACLCALPLRDELGAGELAQGMGLSPSRGSRVVEQLVRRGLLLRAVSDSDRRASRLRLSAKGRALRRRIDALRRACEQRLRQRLSERDLAQVERGLALLLEGLASGG